MNRIFGPLGLALCLAIPVGLAGCGGDEPGRGYAAGGTYDAEDYAGPVQQVTAWQHEDAVWEPKTKRECSKYKAGKPRTSKNCAKWKNVPDGTKMTDDEDWYLVLLDGTRVDVERGDQARYPVGSLYP